MKTKSTYTDHKTFDLACKAIGRDSNKLPDYSGCGMTVGEMKFNLAVYQLGVAHIAVNLNDDGTPWQPKPGDERLYPWFWWEKDKSKPSGSGLSLYDVVYARSTANVASRLTCRSRERAKFLWENYPQLWHDLIVYQP